MCMCLFLCMVCVVLNCVLCVLRVVQVRVLLVLRGQPRGDPRRAPGVARRRHGEGPVEEVGTLPEQTLLRTEGAVRQTAVRPRDGGLQSATDTERYEYLCSSYTLFNLAFTFPFPFLGSIFFVYCYSPAHDRFKFIPICKFTN